MSINVEEILEKEGISNFDKDIRWMSVRELRKNFRFKTNRRLNPTRLIKNLIWQAFVWINDGRMEPIEGNIRSFWYISVKPVLSRLGLGVSGDRYTEKVYDAFVELITIHRLFRYVDFGFLDDRLFHRVIGQANGHLILFVEKDGLFSIIRSLALKHNATAISLNGFSSYMTTEFLVRDMAKAGLLRQSVLLFSLTDYDPSGYWIEQEFGQQLEAYGVQVNIITSVMKPELLPKNLVDIYKFELKKSSRTANWMEVTNGIDGKACGLEADALGGSRIRGAFIKALQPYLAKPGRTGLYSETKLKSKLESWIGWLTAEPGNC